MLEEKLDKLKDIWCSIEKWEDGRYVVSVEFPDGYNVYDSEDEKISVFDDRKKSGRFWYVAKDDTVSLIEVIEFIEATVNANIEAIKRAMLYEAKMKELQNLFNNEQMSYNELEALSFNIPQKAVFKETARPTLKANKPKKNSDKEDKKIISSPMSNNEVGVETIAIEDGNANKVVSKEEIANISNGEMVDGVNVDELRGKKS